MKKPDSLRTHILAAVKELQRDPDRMLIFTDKGNVRCTGARGLSFEYVYDLNFILTEYSGELRHSRCSGSHLSFYSVDI